MARTDGVSVVLQGVSKSYGNDCLAVRDLHLEVNPGEWLVIVGPSGCGKTTTLRLIAGLEAPSSGTVALGGRVVNETPPWQRNVAMVFQRPALLPTHTLRKNLAQVAAANLDVDKLMDMLGLFGLGHRLPHQLSGGQQQRVALGRALARQAAVELLDEPLGQVDAPLRDELRRDLKLWRRERASTVVSVTHDPREAWSLADRVAVMHEGRILQVGAPAEIERRPCNRFVATFFAQQPMNFFDVQLREKGNLIQWTSTDWPEAIPGDGDPLGPTVSEATLGLRAEDVRVGSAGMQVEAALVEPAPQGCWMTCINQGRRVTGWADRPIRPGERVGIMMDWNKTYVFERKTGRTLRTPG